MSDWLNSITDNFESDYFIFFLQILFDLIKGTIWPISIIFLILIFKNDIRLLLPRLRKFGVQGVEVDPVDNQRRAEPDIGSTRNSKAIISNNTPVISAVESRILKNLEQFDKSDHESILVRALAEEQLVSTFERINRLIFGSQLLMLRRLNDQNSMLITEAEQIYETEAKMKYNEEYKDQTFQNWLDFLLKMELIYIRDDKLYITIYGIEMLAYYTRHRMFWPRAL